MIKFLIFFSRENGLVYDIIFQLLLTFLHCCNVSTKCLVLKCITIFRSALKFSVCWIFSFFFAVFGFLYKFIVLQNCSFFFILKRFYFHLLIFYRLNVCNQGWNLCGKIFMLKIFRSEVRFGN